MKLIVGVSDRFWSKVDTRGVCWEWTASVDGKGYGQFNLGREDGKVQMRRAHRLAFELLGIPLEHGMDLDHLCRNKRCVNPDHIEQVSHAENVRRGRAGHHQGNVRVMCKRNLHKLAESGYVRPDGRRYCRECVK